MAYISTTLRQYVEKRASLRCEYCLLDSSLSFFSHEVDHVIAVKHGGKTEENNLALACWRCNRYKGTDLGSFDPQTNTFSFLFNPRLHNWSEHFIFEETKIVGLTPEGRTTSNLLQLNSDERVTERGRLLS